MADNSYRSRSSVAPAEENSPGNISSDTGRSDTSSGARIANGCSRPGLPTGFSTPSTNSVTGTTVLDVRTLDLRATMRSVGRTRNQEIDMDIGTAKEAIVALLGCLEADTEYTEARVIELRKERDAAVRQSEIVGRSANEAHDSELLVLERLDVAIAEKEHLVKKGAEVMAEVKALKEADHALREHRDALDASRKEAFEERDKALAAQSDITKACLVSGCPDGMLVVDWIGDLKGQVERHENQFSDINKALIEKERLQALKVDLENQVYSAKRLAKVRGEMVMEEFRAHKRTQLDHSELVNLCVEMVMRYFYYGEDRLHGDMEDIRDWLEDAGEDTLR